MEIPLAYTPRKKDPATLWEREPGQREMNENRMIRLCSPDPFDCEISRADRAPDAAYGKPESHSAATCSVGTSKNQLSFHGIDLSDAANRMLLISVRVGSNSPLSHRETVACATFAIAAKSFCDRRKTVFRMNSIGFILNIYAYMYIWSRAIMRSRICGGYANTHILEL